MQKKGGEVRKAGRPKKPNMVYQQLRFPVDMERGSLLAIAFVKRRHAARLKEDEFLENELNIVLP